MEVDVVVMLSVLLAACGGAKSEPAATTATVPPAPPAAPKVSRGGPPGTAPTEVSGEATMTPQGELWVLQTGEGLPLCPPDGLYQEEGYVVRYAGTMRPPRPNVRVRCAAVDYTSTEPVKMPTDGVFTGVSAELTEASLRIWMAPEAAPVEACLPSGLRADAGARFTVSGHPAAAEAKGCTAVVLTALEPAG